MALDLFILVTSLVGGGAERVAIEIANGLCHRLNLKFITIHKINKSDVKFNLNVDPISLGFNFMNKIPKILIYLIEFPIYVIKYVLLLRKYNPGVSLSILEIDNILNLIACRLTGVKAIISAHGNVIYPEMPRILRMALQIEIILAKRYCYKIVVVSQGIKCDLIEYYHVDPEIIQVIYNCVDINSIKCLMHEDIEDVQIKNSKVPILISVGSLYPIKGHRHLIRVFAEVVKTHPSKLVICGDGYLRNELAHLARELHVENEVIFLGWCDNPFKYVKNSSIFILSSLSEGFGLVLVEAMICGCPIVSTDCGSAVHEILERWGCGLICDKIVPISNPILDPLNKSELSMKNLICALLENEELRLSLCISPGDVDDYFICDNLEQYYQLVLVS